MSVPVEITFGTDGWRGIIADDFTYDSVRVATQGIAQYLISRPNPTAVIGYDTRFSSDLFAREVAQVLAGNGVKAFLSRMAKVDTCAGTDAGVNLRHPRQESERRAGDHRQP